MANDVDVEARGSSCPKCAMGTLENLLKGRRIIGFLWQDLSDLKQWRLSKYPAKYQEN